MGSCPQILHVLAVSCRFSLALDPRGRLGGLGEKAGSVVRNLKTMRVVYCDNVSCSSGASLPAHQLQDH